MTTTKEFIDYVNNTKFHSMKELEDSKEFESSDAPLLVDKQINGIDNYLRHITKVYHCEDGFVGVTGVELLYSDLEEYIEDFDVLCKAEEYTPILCTKYVPKKYIDEVSFNSTQPTQKQLDYINIISGDLGIEFKGKTKEDARQWLSENVPKHKEYKKNLYENAGVGKYLDMLGPYADQV